MSEALVRKLEKEGVGSLTQEEKSLAISFLKDEAKARADASVTSTALQALDYIPGLTRTAALGFLAPEEKRKEMEAAALSGQAPTTSEFLGLEGRMEPGFAREALGFVGDVALDPFSLGVAGVGKKLARESRYKASFAATERKAQQEAADIASVAKINKQKRDAIIDQFNKLPADTSPDVSEKLMNKIFAIEEAPQAGLKALKIKRKVKGLNISDAYDYLTTAPGRVSSKAGDMLRKAAVKDLDQIAARFGKKGVNAPSQVMKRYSIKSIDDIPKLAEKLGGQYDTLLKSADHLGELGQFKMGRALKGAFEDISKRRASNPSPFALEQLDEAEEYLKKLSDMGQKYKKVPNPERGRYFKKGVPETISVPDPTTRPLSFEEASNLKTDLYQKLSTGKWDEWSKAPNSPISKVIAKAANGIKNEIESGVGKALGGDQARIAKIYRNEVKQASEDLGTVLTIGNVIARKSNKEALREVLTPFDHVLMFHAPNLLFAKKAGELGKSGRFKMATGTALKRFGESGLSTEVTKQAAIHTGLPEVRSQGQSIPQNVRSLTEGSTPDWVKVMQQHTQRYGR